VAALALAAGALATGAIVFHPGKGQPPSPPAPAIVEQRPPLSAPVGVAPVVRPSAPPPAPPPSHASAAAFAPAPVTTARAAAAPSELATAEPAPAASAPNLMEAMSHLEAARTALEAGDPAMALAHVTDYEHRFPNGALSPEASVLRIDALVALGADADALKAADRFLAAMPDSPHARHVSAVVAQIRDRATNR
jgi:hypothetical protein